MAAVNCCLCSPKKREKEVERRVRERERERGWGGGELNSSRDTRQSHLLFLQSALCLCTRTLAHSHIHTHTLHLFAPRHIWNLFPLSGQYYCGLCFIAALVLIFHFHFSPLLFQLAPACSVSMRSPSAPEDDGSG